MKNHTLAFIGIPKRNISRKNSPKLFLMWLAIISVLLSSFIDVIPISAEEESNDFPNQVILTHGIPQIGVFSNISMSHNWRIENIPIEQVIYFSVDPKAPYSKSEFTVGLYTSDGVSFNHIRSDSSGFSPYLGSFTTPISGDWILQVNDTRIVRDMNATYEILVSIPMVSYSEDKALEVEPIPWMANFTIPHEIHYWKIFLNKNQNGTLVLKEVDSSVLFKARLGIYRENFLQNPVLPFTEIRGGYNFSWNAGTQATYIIEIEHNQETSQIGLYNISFNAAPALYSFQTAGKLQDNHTTPVRINQEWTAKEYYFAFQVNHSRTGIFIWLFEDNRTTSEVLDLAIVEIFAEGGQNPIFRAAEEQQDRDGEINITNTLLLDIGTYYLVVSPQDNAIGVFYIHLEIQPPRPFVWDVSGLLLIISTLVALPGYLIYLDIKGKWFRVNQWSVPAHRKETYKLLKDSFRGIYKLDEVPEDSILVRVASIPVSTYALISCVESTEEETLVFSRRLRRKVEWLIYFFIGAILYTSLNLLSYLFLSQNFLPFYIDGITNLLLVLILPLTILVIPVLFVNVSPIFAYNQLNNRLSYVIQNYQRASDSGIEPVQQLDLDQIIKNINYVRVLWNQAKRAFKEKNYELFVIKADTAVKNLLFVRYQQIVSLNLLSKPDFTMQVEELRTHGYDLPSSKKIIHYRNIRNRIVHSSVTLGEKESIDCYAYYSTFITRLGLRPT
ncbi:MAG: hypothetical protein ACFFE8_00560 [Candidatus Heimdallarchaeota archaeon]